MAAFGKPDRTGRSSGKLDHAEHKLLGPPAGTAWTWVTAELIASPAWRGLSINARRILDFLLVEHVKHAGRENGRLRAPYAQLVAWGCARDKIASAIAQLEEHGLICVEQRGGIFGIDTKRTPSLYRLTWIGCVNPKRAATDEWKRWRPPQQAVQPVRVRG